VSRRTERIGEQLRGEIARILREETTDPRIGMVTLTRVDVAPDLGNARVYWSVMSEKPEELESTAEGLASAAAFVRRRLSRVLELRRVPELHFRHDPSLSLGDSTLAALKEVDDGSA
jgi:ribosome-binding factor A